VYQLDADEAKSILRAFRNVFPDCSVWTGADLEWMMVGRKNPGAPVSAKQFGAQWTDPVVRKELLALSLMSPGQLGSLFIADGQRLDEWIGDALPLTDNYPRRVSHGFYQDSTPAYRQIMEQDASLANFMSSPTVDAMWPGATKGEAANHFGVRNTIDALLAPSPLHDISLDGFHESLNNRLLDGFVVYAFASDHDAVGIIEEVLPDAVKEGKETQTCDNAGTGLHLSAYFLLKGQRAERSEDRAAYWQTAVKYMGLTADLYPPHSRLANRLHVMRIYLESLMGQNERAEKLKAEYIERVPEYRLEREQQMKDLQQWLKRTLSSKR